MNLLDNAFLHLVEKMNGIRVGGGINFKSIYFLSTILTILYEHVAGFYGYCDSLGCALQDQYLLLSPKTSLWLQRAWLFPHFVLCHCGGGTTYQAPS